MDESRAVLAVDVGNTLTKIARVSADRVEPVGSVSTSDAPDGLVRVLGDAPSIRGLAAWICSVVDPVSGPVVDACRRGGASDVQVIGSDVPLPVAVDYETPETLGDDRVIAAYAAWRRFPSGAIVVDAGTAMTVDWIDQDGTFRGGAIAPGPGILSSGLKAAAPALQSVEPDPDVSWPGRSTRESLVVGVTAATRGLVRDVIAAARARAGHDAQVLITGGAADLVSELMDAPHGVEPELLFRGIALTAGVPWNADAWNDSAS